MHGRTSANWQWEDYKNPESGSGLDRAFFMPLSKEDIEDIAAQGVRGPDGVGGCYATAAKILYLTVIRSSTRMFEAYRDSRLSGEQDVQPIEIAPL